MALSTVIPSKHVYEVHQLVVDFSPLLVGGETILPLTVVVTIGVFSGVDSNPTAVLVPGPSIIGSVVSQGLQQGLPGVIYFLDVTAQTSASHTYHIESKLAVLPDNYPAGGAFISYYFTSNIYPIFYTDTVRSTSRIQSALLDTLIKNYTLTDTARSTAHIVSAMVNSTIQNYTLSDTARVVSAHITSALVNSVVHNYTFTDTAHSNAAIVSAKVTTTVIVYSFSDTAHSTAAITSATVT